MVTEIYITDETLTKNFVVNSMYETEIWGGGQGGTQSPLPSPFPPTSLPLSPLQPHFPPPVRFFPPPDKIFVLVHKLKRSQEPKLILKIAYQRPICIFRVQRVKTYFSLFVLMLNVPDNPSRISGREKNGRSNYFKIKSPRKYWTRPRSNSQPLYLQSDMHLHRLRCPAP